MGLIWENVILAVNGLRANKMRALLTMLGIIIGIGAVIGIYTVGDSLNLTIAQNMQEAGADDVYVMVSPKTDNDVESKVLDGAVYGQFENSSDISEDDLITKEMVYDLCDKFPDEIYAINVSHSSGSGIADLNGETAKVSLNGSTVGYFITNKLEMLAGRMLSASDFDEGKNVVVASDKLCNKLFGGNYDKAIGQTINVTIKNKSEKFTIVGVYEYGGAQMRSSGIVGLSDNITTTLYAPLKTSLAFDNAKEVFPYLQIVTDVNADPDELAPKIENFFKPYYSSNRDYEITTLTMTTMVSMLTTMVSTITTAISIVAGIALLVGGIGVMNIMLVSVTERTREIGTRKALGAKNSSIRIQFIVEAMIICFIGGVLGVIFGSTLGVVTSHILGYPAAPSVPGIIIALLFSTSIGLFFGYYPANKAAKMNPIDALRYE